LDRLLDSNTRGLRLVEASHSCYNCDIRGLLQKVGPGNNQLPKEACAIRCRGPYLPGDYIYRSGDPFASIYAITSGSVKTEIPSSDGSLQIIDFYLKGELFGAEALGKSKHVNDAIALERSWICELPVEELENISQQYPSMLRELLKMLASRLRHANMNLLSVRNQTSEQRILYFLLDLADRTKSRRNLAGDEIPLPMTKGQIASYLGISPETLSRRLRRLHDAGIIHNKTNSFRLLAPEKVNQVLFG
jgi:CRP/FNR family transcriptional regulator